jgi:hypothetical protein
MTDKKLYVISSENVSVYTEAYVTIYYTKTTDTAGSGTWNGQGGLAHHYSTNETVIGTWIDGKPIYEKTVEIANLPSTANVYTDYSHGISNISKIIDYDIMAIPPDGGSSKVPVIGFSGGQFSPTYSILGTVSLTAVRILVGTNRSTWSGIATIRYTKTTD